MPASKELPPAFGPQRGKSLIKCSYCRNDKKQCVSVGRDWQAGGKCERCTRLQRPCSPREKPPRKSKMTLSGEEGEYLYPKPLTDRMTDGFRESPCPYHSYIASSSGGDEICATNSTYRSVNTAHFKKKCLVGKLGVVTIEARACIARLGNINASREILRKCSNLCEDVKIWLGTPVPIKTALEAAITAVVADFHDEVQKIWEFIKMGLGQEAETILSALHLIMYRFAYPLDFDALPQRWMDHTVLQQLSHISWRTRTIYSDADLICASAFDLTTQNDTSPEMLETYRKASKTLTGILANLVLNTIERQSILPRAGIPACHVAYLHGNCNAAFVLWKSDEVNRSAVDMLGRTLLHVVTYQSDVQMLRRLLKHDETAAPLAPADIYGLSPLAIAACLGDVECFSLLWQYKANSDFLDYEQRSVLALAARNGRYRIVTCILQSGRIPPSPRHELLEAITSNRQDMISLLTEFYRQNESQGYLGRETQAEAVARLLDLGANGFAQAIANLKSKPMSGTLDTIRTKPDSYSHLKAYLCAPHEASSKEVVCTSSLWVTSPAEVDITEHALLMPRQDVIGITCGS